MKSTRFNFWRTLSILCAVFFVSFAFMSCQQADDDENSSSGSEPVVLAASDGIIGEWASSGEKYIFTADTFQNYYYDGDWISTYAGDNLYIIKTSDTSGYVYMKYTIAMNSDYSYSSSAPDVGKWYAISYKELTSSSVSLSGAYKSDGVTSTDTLEEAVEEFTIANDYFSSYSELSK